MWNQSPVATSCLCVQHHMFTGWFIKIFVHIFLVSDSCQPPVLMATTQNNVLTLTLDGGRTPQNLGRTCNLKSQVLSLPPAHVMHGMLLWHHSEVAESKHTTSNTVSPCFQFALYHTWMHACRMCRKGEKKAPDRDTNKQLTWWLHNNCSAVFGKQPLLAEPVNGLCNRTFPPRARVSKDAN